MACLEHHTECVCVHGLHTVTLASVSSTRPEKSVGGAVVPRPVGLAG